MTANPALAAAAGLSDARSLWLRSLARVARVPLAIAIAAPLLGGLLTAAQALWLATILDHAIRGSLVAADAPVPLLVLAAIVALRAGLAAIGERAGSRAAERIKFAVRSQLVAALTSRQPDWMRQQAGGAMASAVIDQVEALDGYFSRFLPAMFAAAILPVAFAIGLLPVDIVVGLLFLITAPLIPLFMALVGWGAEATSRRHMAAMARLSAIFADRLRGLVTLKLFGRAEAEVDRVKTASEELASRTLAVLRIAFLSSAVLEFFAALGVAGVALYVGLTYLGFLDLRISTLGLGAGLFCLLMAPEVYMPLRNLAAHYHDRAAAKAAVAELFQLVEKMGAAPEPLPEEVPPPKSTGPSALLVRGLAAGQPGRGIVFHDLDLDVPAGTSVAILGQSGIGKSTLLESIARLRPSDGTIRLGGLDLTSMAEDELRRRVAFLPQRPRLFHGTLASNIRLARPDASIEAVRAAAEQAALGDLLLRLPMGIESEIGERGRGLSGGEIQRLAFARLFLADPELLLLDEPTAHLDIGTEGRVLDALLGFSGGRTLVVATHSTALARRMDRIFRMAAGRLLPVPHRRSGAAVSRLSGGDAS